MKSSKFLLVLAAVVFALASCQGPVSTDPLDNNQIAQFRSSYLQTYDLEKVVGLESRSVAPILSRMRLVSGSKATVPVLDVDRSFVSGSVDNYPEPGMVTSWTVTLHSGTQGAADAVYRVVSVTTYPASNTLVDSYIEEYFVRDILAIVSADPLTYEEPGIWNEHDPIVNTAGVQDQAYRLRMELRFRDGSVRYEKIVKLYGANEGYAPFDVDGSLAYPDFAYPAVAVADSMYSSVVVYKQDVAKSHSFWFWNGDVSGYLLGVRYYTEHADGDTYVGTMVAYERAVQSYETWGGAMSSQLSELFVGSEYTMLLESVYRKEVIFDYAGAVLGEALSASGRMGTHVVDTTGLGADFLIGLLESDEAVFSDWDGAPYHVPSGQSAEELVFQNPEAQLTYVEYLGNPDGTNIPVLVSSLPTDEQLAELYTSIQSGVWASLLVDTDDDIADGDLPNGGTDQTIIMPEIGVAEFDQEQGYQVPLAADDPSINPVAAGTVEAWVWVDTHADTAGIVHKGIKTDFSDEGYTLQFMGVGYPAFGLVKQVPYATRIITSSLKLNTGKWYYLVGRWSATEGKMYLNIYYKDTRNKTKVWSSSTSYTPGDPVAYPFADSGPLVIGSQFMEDYGLKGFYGFDGKINGVVISTYKKADIDLRTFFDTNFDKTTLW